ncbi:ficolin-1-like [Saccostrea echinata]|uniref:ficolin-1-like n=1 Tax=Saccostrea echinata TaxID=191078 RepID=UPI002A8115DA|nr:ficolin-1-like [Saccostrea echinata]
MLTFFLILPVYSFEVREFTFTYSTDMEMQQNSDIFSEFEINRLGSPLIQCAAVCAQSGMCYGVELCNTTPKRCRLWEKEFTNNGSGPVATKCSRYTKKIKKANECSDSCACFDSTGVYNLTVDGKFMEVKCFRGNYMWTVIQRRMDGSVLFNRSWSSYKNGFGSLLSEFWLGNDNIHLLTKNGLTYLRIDLKNSTGEWNYAEYSNFSVDTEENKYKLTVSGYSGEAGDDFSYHNGMYFTTYDADNDMSDTITCSMNNHGGWWFNNCYKANLNGEYDSKLYKAGVVWYSWLDESLKEARMMIREP